MIIDAKEINTLAPMSTSVAKLITISLDPESELQEITRLIELDSALTLNLLRWANSAWSGGQVKIATVKEAVVRLGLNNIIKMSIGTQIADPLKNTCPGYNLKENELWQHTVAAALAAENIQLFISRETNRLAFTAALLHDVGKLLVNRYLKQDILDKIQELINEEELTYIEAERQALGTDHAQVGGEVATLWKLPEPLIHAIQAHHQLDSPPDDVLDIVICANMVAKFIGIGLGSEQMNIKINPAIPKRLGLETSGMDGLCAVVKYELAKAEAFLGG